MEMLRQGEKMNKINIIGVVFLGISPKTANVLHP